MGMPVKLSDELVAAARKEAATTDRSITGQIEGAVADGGLAIDVHLRASRYGGQPSRLACQP